MRGNIRTLLTSPLCSYVENAAIGEHKVVRAQGGDRSPMESSRSAALSAMAEGAQETCRLSRVRLDVGAQRKVERTEDKNKNMNRPLKSTRPTNTTLQKTATAAVNARCKSRRASDSRIPTRKLLEEGEGVCGEE